MGDVAAGVRKDLPGRVSSVSSRRIRGRRAACKARTVAGPGAPTPALGHRPVIGVTSPQHAVQVLATIFPTAPVACPGLAVRPSSALSSFDHCPGCRAQSTRGSCVLGPSFGPRDPSALFWARRIVVGDQSRRALSRPLPVASPYDLSPSQNFVQTLLKDISANLTEWAPLTAPRSVCNSQHSRAMPSTSSASVSLSRAAPRCPAASA